MAESKLLETSFIDENFVQILNKSALEAMKTFKISDKAGLHAWASSRNTLLGRIKPNKDDIEDNNNGLTTDRIFELIEGKSRLTCISISDPYTIKELMINLTDEFLHRRKRKTRIKKNGKVGVIGLVPVILHSVKKNIGHLRKQNNLFIHFI